MPLHNLQIALTRLYTDGAFRAQFYENRRIACRGIDLSESDIGQLEALDRDQVERFARSLKQKRLGSVRHWLPATDRVLRERFAHLFYEYCDRYPSSLDAPQEAIRFAGMMQQAQLDTPAYLADVIACEQLRLQVLHSREEVESPESQASIAFRERPVLSLQSFPRLTARACVAEFQFDMENLYPMVTRGEAIKTRRDPCFALIGKVHGAMRIRIKRINRATARLLKMCDGSHRLEAIVDEVASEMKLNSTDTERFSHECVSFLAPLVRSDLIAFD